MAHANASTLVQELAAGDDTGSTHMASGNDAALVGSGSDDSGGDTKTPSCVGRNNRGVTSGYARNIGRRPEMEDALTIYPRLLSAVSCGEFGGCRAPDCHFAAQKSPVHYFGVFDGHGGKQVSHYCAKRLHQMVAEEWERGGETEWSKRWECALSRAYQTADNAVCDDPSVGSTAVVAILSPCQIVVANCGDSRAVLCRGTQAIPLTVDHKLSRKDEAERICEAGGRILFVGCLRVDGVLSMTRAIGDKNLKPMVVPDPEVTFMARSEEDECLILATDGVWDVMSNEEATTLAYKTLRRQRKLSATSDTPSRPAQYAADIILDQARLAGSSDNISVIVVDLKLLRKRRPQTTSPETGPISSP